MSGPRLVPRVPAVLIEGTVMTPRSIPIVLIAGVLATGAVTAADVTLKATFKSLDAGAINLAGKPVAALVISADESLRVSGEEALARELNARGMQALATYRFVPKEELRNPDTARPWFERRSIEAIVALRPVTAETSVSYGPVTWTSPNYGSLWGYYGYGWGSVTVFGPPRKETVVVVETTIYSVPSNQLLWAAVSESRNPSGLSQFVADLATTTVKEMQKQGLARRQPK